MNKKIFKTLIIITLLSVIVSCESAVEGFEVSPNNPTDAAYDQMVQGTQLFMEVSLAGEMSRLSGIWIGYFTGADRQYIAYESYDVSAQLFNGLWGNLYAGVIKNSRIIQEKAEAVGNDQMVGMAQVLEAWSFGTATSLWGDIPFSEAVTEGNDNPVYDAQAAVYSGVQSLLDDAITNLSSPNDGGGTGLINDLYYGGDPSIWIELAHSLKARYYLHTGDYALAESEANLGISSPANDIVTNVQSAFAFTVRDWNLYFQFMWWDREGYMTAENAYLPTLLTTRQDANTDESARRGWYYLEPGDYSSLDPNYYGVFFATEPNPLMTYVETQLIAAEAASRQNDDPGALTYLNNVRAANDAFYGGGFYAPYVIGDFATSNDLLIEILEEKYVSLYGQLESFVDVARTDNILGIPSRTSANPIPTRFLYPQSEVNSNSNFPGQEGLYTETPVNQ